MQDTNNPNSDLQPDALHEVFDAVADLIASDEPSRGAGSFWRVRSETGEFLYRETAQSDAGYHILTQSGVSLMVVSSNGVYHADAFGAVSDGVTADTAAIQLALDTVPTDATLRFSSGRT